MIIIIVIFLNIIIIIINMHTYTHTYTHIPTDFILIPAYLNIGTTVSLNIRGASFLPPTHTHIHTIQNTDKREVYKKEITYTHPHVHTHTHIHTHTYIHAYIHNMYVYI